MSEDLLHLDSAPYIQVQAPCPRCSGSILAYVRKRVFDVFVHPLSRCRDCLRPAIWTEIQHRAAVVTDELDFDSEDLLYETEGLTNLAILEPDISFEMEATP